MSIAESLPVSLLDYERTAEEYFLSLPLEHFMEAVPQATQREITLESFALLKTRRADFQYYSELLVQYVHNGRLRRVVPDNMVVFNSRPAQSQTSYVLAHESAPPFMVLEWVSESSETKEYEERLESYEQELKTPYCLHYHPDRQDLRVYRHDGDHYVRLEPDLRGRVAVPELELEIGLQDGWVRYWHRGELLELPAELQARVDSLHEQVTGLNKQVAKQSEELTTHVRTIENLISRLKRAVERRAISANRTDILQLLPSTNDDTQLDRWLDELEA